MAGQPLLLGWLARVLKSIFIMCQLKTARRVSNVGKAVLPQSFTTQPS
jgi:hypothetical protein